MQYTGHLGRWLSGITVLSVALPVLVFFLSLSCTVGLECYFKTSNVSCGVQNKVYILTYMYWLHGEAQYQSIQSFYRMYLAGGQVAHRPDANRISACICLKLSKEFTSARNRPKDNSGKTLPVAQSIVQIYSHIRQLIEDCRELQATNLVLVPINTTTVNNW